MSKEYINSFLGKIYYINLENRIDRQIKMEDNLNSLGLNYERFKAIDISNLDLTNYSQFDFSFFSKYIRINMMYKWVKGTIGCFLSHYNVLKQILLEPNPKKYYLVLEDDCFPSLDHIQQSIKFSESKNDLDLLRLNSFYHIISNKSINGWKVDDNHKNMGGKINYDGGCHYNLYKYESIEKILKFLESNIVFFIDGMFNTNKLNSYWLEYGSPIIQLSASSIKNKLDEKTALLYLKASQRKRYINK